MTTLWAVHTTPSQGATQKDQNLVFKTDYRLMQVKSIAECSNGSILQYFWPFVIKIFVLSFSEWPLKTVLLYVYKHYELMFSS